MERSRQASGGPTGRIRAVWTRIRAACGLESGQPVGWRYGGWVDSHALEMPADALCRDPLWTTAHELTVVGEEKERLRVGKAAERREGSAVLALPPWQCVVQKRKRNAHRVRPVAALLRKGCPRKLLTP